MCNGLAAGCLPAGLRHSGLCQRGTEVHCNLGEGCVFGVCVLDLSVSSSVTVVTQIIKGT